MSVKFTSDIGVELLWTNFSDDIPIIAARTSTKGGDATSEAGRGLLRALIRDHHGVPFEHMTMTVRIHAPIFVMRQIVKHRAGVSFSEESGRYRELEPVFYVPDINRPLKQVGKPMEYKFSEDEDVSRKSVDWFIKSSNAEAWDSYQDLLNAGVTREIARAVLPVNIYSTAVVTFNARSLMHFLSLRTSNTGKSHPQAEVEMVAKQIEELFSTHAPLTHESFTEFGRVAP